MHRLHGILTALFLGLAGCDLTGGGGRTADASASPPGSVHVVIDTASGSDVLVQFQVAAATFERADGATTGNVLTTPRMVTLADPSGEVDGLLLQGVPTGDYSKLHLLLVPGSGTAMDRNGTAVPVTSVADLTVPIADGLQHSAEGRSWLAIGHNGSVLPATLVSPLHWEPAMSGRLDGGPQVVGGLRVALVRARQVATQLGAANDGVLQVEFAPSCVFGDPGSGDTVSDDFLRGIAPGDDLLAEGELHRDGTFAALRLRRSGRGSDTPRLLGRIDSLRPATSRFVLHVLAEVRRGERRLLPTPQDVLVDASNAGMRASDDHHVLAFGDLQVGQLAKVEWTSRAPVNGGLDFVVADSIEITSRAVPMRPEWQGVVQTVDWPRRTVVVVPFGDNTIEVHGESVTTVDVHVALGVPIDRQEPNTGGHTSIQIDTIVPGTDRIWWYGAAAGPGSVDASWVRVRDRR